MTKLVPLCVRAYANAPTACLGLVTSGITQAASTVAVPLLAGTTIDVITRRESGVAAWMVPSGWRGETSRELVWLATLTLFIGIAGNVAGLMLNWLATALAEKATAGARVALLRQLLVDPRAIKVHDQDSGRVITAIDRQLDSVKSLLASTAPGIFNNFVTLVMLVPAFVILWPRLAGMVLLVLALSFAAAQLFRGLVRSASSRVITARARLTATTVDLIDSPDRIMFRTFRAAHAAERHYAASTEEVRRTSLSNVTVGLAYSAPGTMGTTASIALIYGVGGLEVIHGAGDIGALVALTAALFRIIGPIRAMISTPYALRVARTNVDRIETDLGINDISDLFTRRRTAPEPGASPAVASPSGQVLVVEDVSFGYDVDEQVIGRRTVIDHVSLRVDPGETIFITGDSGAGKTTLARLMAGVLAPTSGSITLGDEPAVAALASRHNGGVQLVSGQSRLFDVALRDGLTLWDETISDEAIHTAVELSCCDDFLDRSDVTTTRHAADYSRGQVLRLCVARALIRRPSVLILDEVASALDEHLTKELVERLGRARWGLSLVIVGHRPDHSLGRVMTMRNGRLLGALDAGRA